VVVDDRDVEELAGVYEELNEEGKEKVVKVAGILLEGQRVIKNESISSKKNKIKECKV
jgi:uncharacterized protein (UPF0297 family)